MNKQNLQRVIDAIKFDGQKKFNMAAFIGKLNDDRWEEYVFEDDELASKYPVSRVRLVDEGTNMFNCTSMGCIAGFATAIANDWKAPKWLAIDDHSVQMNGFEETSNDFLGFTYQEGRNLYYGDSNSIWKWLMYVEPGNYPDLRVEEHGSLEEAEEYGYEWDDSELCIDFATIDYLTAVNVLTRILNEEIALADIDGSPYYIRKEAVVS
jgi:hypothetical protein